MCIFLFKPNSHTLDLPRHPTHIDSDPRPIMETILRRRRHREGQAWGLMQAALRELDSRTTTDTTEAEGTKGGKRAGARTLEALHVKVRWDVCVAILGSSYRIGSNGSSSLMRVQQHRCTASSPAAQPGARGYWPHSRWSKQRTTTAEKDLDLTLLPGGWEIHTLPQKRPPGEPPLILQPRGVFSRPLEACVNGEKHLVVLFHPGRSTVRIGEDSAAWRWAHSKRLM